MGRPTVFRGKDGWEVDKVVRGDRLRHSGAASYAAAKGWLDDELARRKTPPPATVATFDRAAAHYVDKHENKVSIELDIYLLGLVVPFIGHRALDQVDDEALEPFIEAMHAGNKPATRPLKNKTINLALDRVRRILNLAARKWRKTESHGCPGCRR
jgi:hypothetical protein